MSDPSFENPCLGRMLAGARPRGSIHIGELAGAIESWVRFQDHYECIFIIADIEARNNPGNSQFIDKCDIYEMLADWLAAGISPNHSIIALESSISELVMLAELLRNFSDGSLWLAEGSVAQSSDVIEAIEILLFKADTIPLINGQSHNGLIAAQNLGTVFNLKYGDVFPIIKPRYIPGEHIPGLDGRPMQRSFGNLVLLKEFDEETEQKISAAPAETLLLYTKRFDRDKIRANAVIKNFNDGNMNDADLHKYAAGLINDYLHSIRVKRDKWIANPDELESVLQVGTRRARAIAQQTISEVNERLRRILA